MPVDTRRYTEANMEAPSLKRLTKSNKEGIDGQHRNP